MRPTILITFGQNRFTNELYCIFLTYFYVVKIKSFYQEIMKTFNAANVFLSAVFLQRQCSYIR